MNNLSRFFRNMLCLLSLPSGIALAQEIPTPQWRPAYHFSPPQNWCNDPNGLLFLNNQWHLFYQHNPLENKWGHMSWGHAVSSDFVHWNNLPVAIPEDSAAWIFSGSAVVDSKNSSGLAASDSGLVAVYTADFHGTKEEQHMAYSNNGGLTWQKYAQNPVLGKPQNAGYQSKTFAKDFRDPNVFWHEFSQQWVMAVVLPTNYTVQFYGSKNLIDWELLSEFKQQGDVRMIWECPALKEVPLKNMAGEVIGTKWILLLSSSGPHEGYVGMQYFVGNFDGISFTNDNPADVAQYVDYGKDFYAAIPFNNTDRSIILGWMASWQYTDQLPTVPWKGQMNLPREIFLQNTTQGLKLFQQPVSEIANAPNFQQYIQIQGQVIPENANFDFRTQSTSYKIEATLEWNDASEVGIDVLKKPGTSQKTRLGFRTLPNEIFIDRSASGKIISDKFKTESAAPFTPEGKSLKLEIYVDAMSVEVFVNNGEMTLSEIVFPEEQSTAWTFYSIGGPLTVRNLNVMDWSPNTR